MDSIIHLLECPQTKSEIEIKDGQLYSSQADLSFPNIQGIPWFFKTPETFLLQWQAKANDVLSTFIELSIRAKKELQEEPELLKETKDRLELLEKAYNENKQALELLLAPLVQSKSSESVIHYAVKEKLPTHQNIQSYYDNIFRDWAWETSENKAALDATSPLMPKDPIETMLVLGAGACRLPYDLHKIIKPKKTICVDFNPLLLLSAQKIIRGEDVQLYEFPRSPLNLKNSAVKQTCKTVAPITSDFHFLFADATNLPFKAQSVDCIVTPWLIDIIPQDFKDFAKRVNRTLKKDGTWINFGPLGFSHQKESLCYSKDEILKILEESGFKTNLTEQTEIPYLQSPHSGHGRIEKVFSFQAQKEKSVKEPKSFDYLPSWLKNFDEPIELTHSVQDIRFKNQIHFEILSSVDGNQSFNNIKDLMIKHYGMSEDQAKESLFSLLSKVHESSLRRV